MLPRRSIWSTGLVLRDTHRTISEESTIPEVVELVQRAFEAASRHDVDAVMSLYVPDAVAQRRVSG
jgi:hypothetical protein